MNRALRRQQTKEPKAGTKAMPRVMPGTGTRQATPARRRGFGRFVPRFIMDVWSELTKVVWPDREDVVYLTIVVVIVTIIFGALLGAIDVGFGWLVDRTLLH